VHDDTKEETPATSIDANRARAGAKVRSADHVKIDPSTLLSDPNAGKGATYQNVWEHGEQHPWPAAEHPRRDDQPVTILYTIYSRDDHQKYRIRFPDGVMFDVYCECLYDVTLADIGCDLDTFRQVLDAATANAGATRVACDCPHRADELTFVVREPPPEHPANPVTGLHRCNLCNHEVRTFGRRWTVMACETPAASSAPPGGDEVCERCDHEAVKLKDEGPVYIHLHVNEFIDPGNNRTMVAHVLPANTRDCYIITESREHVEREWERWKAGFPDVEKCEECFNLLTHALTTGKSVARFQQQPAGV
jgi:hypothetical protein